VPPHRRPAPCQPRRRLLAHGLGGFIR
jgi:hypothetical protein